MGLLGVLSLATPACSGDDSAPAGSGGAASDAGSDSGSQADSAVCLAGSGPIPAAEPDTHCIGDDGGRILSAADQCPGSSAVDPDAAVEELPGPHDGNEADDDDCKYHVKFSSTCVANGQNVTFTLTLTSLADGQPVSGAAPDIEGVLGTSHPLPNSNTTSSETSPGVYRIGPVLFNESGTWLLRFHLFETCVDVEGSKHGHAAFNIVVP